MHQLMVKVDMVVVVLVGVVEEVSLVYLMMKLQL